MMKPGLCSISFRSLTPREVCQAAADAGIRYIEWGSDVHAPRNDAARLQEILQLQKEYSITCCSYGTYFYLGIDPVEQLPEYIAAAKTLGTNLLRLWPGKKSPWDLTAEEKAKLFADCKEAARIAEKTGVIFCLECHRNSYTEVKETALELMKYVNSPHFRMYWQPSTILGFEESLNYAKAIAPYTYQIHAFYFENKVQLPLALATSNWKAYMKEFTGEHCMLLEFMPGNQVSALPTEAQTLRDLIEGNL